MKIRNILFGLVLLGLSNSAMALPIINGTLNFAGFYTYNGTTIFNSTLFTFLNPVFTQATGSLAPLSGPPPVGSGPGVNFNALNINATPSQLLWYQTIGSTYYQYVLYSPLYITSTSNSRVITGTGLLGATGYKSTSYNYTLTVQPNTSFLLSFSAASAVPEPMPLALVAIGLIGIGYFSRKRSESQTYA